MRMKKKMKMTVKTIMIVRMTAMRSKRESIRKVNILRTIETLREFLCGNIRE